MMLTGYPKSKSSSDTTPEVQKRWLNSQGSSAAPQLPLPLEPQLDIFLQKCPFASARVIANHFFTTVLLIKKIHRRELRMKTFSLRWESHFLSPGQEDVLVEALKEMFQVLLESKVNNLMESTWATHHGFDISICAPKCLHDRQERSFRRLDRQSLLPNCDHGILHHTRVKCLRRSAESQPI
jgi:hypothetical protein